VPPKNLRIPNPHICQKAGHLQNQARSTGHLSTIPPGPFARFRVQSFQDARTEERYRRAENGPQHQGFCCAGSYPYQYLSALRPRHAAFAFPAWATAPEFKLTAPPPPTMDTEWFHLPYPLQSSSSPPIAELTSFNPFGFISLKAGSMGFMSASAAQGGASNSSNDPLWVIC
jgi:hypothetical protein